MPDKKKLLITASTLPRWEGDTEPRFILDLASHMTDEFDVTILAPAAPGAKDEEVLEGVKIKRYHYFPIHSKETLCYPGSIVPRIKQKKVRALLVPFLFLSLKHTIRKIHKDYDVIHAHWVIPQGIVQSSFSTPYLITGHGSDITTLNNPIVRALKKKCFKKAAGITVVSEYLKSKVMTMTDKQDIKVIPMGCDTKKFGQEFRQEGFFGDDNKKTVLFVGRLAKIKGVEYLIEAMETIDARLVIAGDGPLREELEAKAKELNIDCKFLGSKSHDELRTIYASADVFVAPSITMPDGAQEGLGLVALEAMSSGIPVIGTRSGGIKEIIEDKKTGLLVDEKNVAQLRRAITDILESESLSRTLRHHGFAKALEYDYANTAKRYKECIREILR